MLPSCDCHSKSRGLITVSKGIASSNRLVHAFELSRWDLVLLNHMPAPVVLAGEGTAALKPGAGWVRAVISLGLEVLVVDVSVEVRLRAELLIAAVIRAVVLPVVVTLVVIQFVDLLKLPPALVADELADVTAGVAIAYTRRRRRARLRLVLRRGHESGKRRLR